MPEKICTIPLIRYHNSSRYTLLSRPLSERGYVNRTASITRRKRGVRRISCHDFVRFIGKSKVSEISSRYVLYLSSFVFNYGYVNDGPGRISLTLGINQK
ncbi:hypothetical protein LENED_003079 [Lentinula edodes]|uniref:Uncharacterized protein n=1 Tax=Lentinula edodes TaxID=5353 RepID=A0A1Q3E380_LENED|nr:hypothetical protein LENED_003079 [Lentinula edodes]